MNSPMTAGRCPTCGAELPANAPQGLCPKCLMDGVATQTQAGPPPGHRPEPPPIEAVRAAFSQLEILELIGQGGMGAVFKARQPKLNRFVALKILPESMARDPAFAERLAREGQLLARLNHPNVVAVHDFGSANGFFYLLMEYVDGVNLRQAMQAGRFTAEQALAIVPMICEALQYAHDEGVLHRDIKPENILLDAKGRVKLVDFGIAKLADRDEPASAEANTGAPSDIALTQSGSALGTPSYMAPEQRSSPSTVDQRADIYSLGVVFYEMLTGELPVGNFARPSSKTPMDPRVDDVVMRAMARRKEQRFRTAAEIQTCVETITATQWAPVKPAPDISAAAVARPIQVGWSLKNALAIGLVALFILMLFQLRFLPSYMLQQLSVVIQGDWLQGSVTLGGAVGVTWLVFRVWRRRAWLAEAFRPLAQTNTGPPAGPDSLFSLAWKGVLGLLAIDVLWMLCGTVLMTAQSTRMLQTLPYPFGMSLLFFVDVFLFPALLPILLAIMLVRREVRRPYASIPPASAPAWMARVALLTVAFAIVTSLPITIAPLTSEATMITTVSYGEFVVVLAFALLTRSRIWRAIALVTLVVVLTSGVKGVTYFVFYAPWEQWPVGWSHPMSEFAAVSLDVVTQLLGLLCCTAGLAALLSPSARAAFGLPPRCHRGTEPAHA